MQGCAVHHLHQAESRPRQGETRVVACKHCTTAKCQLWCHHRIVAPSSIKRRNKLRGPNTETLSALYTCQYTCEYTCLYTGRCDGRVHWSCRIAGPHTCVYTCLCTCLHTYIFACVRLYACRYTCADTGPYAHLYVYPYACSCILRAMSTHMSTHMYQIAAHAARAAGHPLDRIGAALCSLTVRCLHMPHMHRYVGMDMWRRLVSKTQAAARAVAAAEAAYQLRKRFGAH